MPTLTICHKLRSTDTHLGSCTSAECRSVICNRGRCRHLLTFRYLSVVRLVMCQRAPRLRSLLTWQLHCSWAVRFCLDAIWFSMRTSFLWRICGKGSCAAILNPDQLAIGFCSTYVTCKFANTYVLYIKHQCIFCIITFFTSRKKWPTKMV